MSTTKLFVELIVIGAGAVLWVVLLTMAILGYRFIDSDLLKSPMIVVGALPFIYVFGIITDRIADAIFEWLWDSDLKRNLFVSKENHERARESLFKNSPKSAELLEYGRSRLRICRGWTINAVLIAIVFDVFLLCSPGLTFNKVAVGAYVSGILFLTAVGAKFAWRRITEAEYRILAQELMRSDVRTNN